MKSAYELAMERLEESDPQKPLTDEQRAEISAIEEKFQAKIAEREVFLGDLVTKARAEGNFPEIAELEEQKVRELAALREEMEEAKEGVRSS